MSSSVSFNRLATCIAHRRPHNGFITRKWILDGWTGQPDYRASAASGGVGGCARARGVVATPGVTDTLRILS